MNRHWWVLPAICAFLLVVCGMGCLVWPAKFLNLLPQTLGACFALAGAIQLIFVFFHRHSPTLPHFVWLSGLVTAITGGVFLFNAHVSLLFLGIFCGIWAITWGVLRSVAAMKKKRLGLSWKTPLTGSIIYIAMGAAHIYATLPPQKRYHLYCHGCSTFIFSFVGASSDCQNHGRFVYSFWNRFAIWVVYHQKFCQKTFFASVTKQKPDYGKLHK